MNFIRKTWAEISLSALKHNIEVFRSLCPNCDIMAVVKANAYGHTAEAVCSVLADKDSGVSYFAVSNLDEAIELRREKVKQPILILGYTPVDAVDLLYENDIIQTVFSTEYASALNNAAGLKGVKIKVHIKLDTGMGRIGFDCRDDNLSGLNEALLAAKSENFEVLGIFTHFAEADRDKTSDDGFTDMQHNRFMRAVKVFEGEGFSGLAVHCANSAATLLDADKHHTVARIGISLYGLTPNADLPLAENLLPVMSFKTVVTQVKEISEGDTVSYGRTYKADKPRKIATLAAGYADGYPRLLSNKAYVLINGKRANIVGRVCMDQMCVDVTDIENCRQGDEAVLFGKGLPVEVLAELCGTINYEIVCGISARVPRVIVD